MKVTLVLEGGGMRGAYTSGVLDCFIDQGLVFEDVVAVSAGACAATSYISQQKGRNIEIFAKFSHDKRYLSMENRIKTGSFFGIDFIFRTIPRTLMPFDYDAFNRSSMKLTVVCTHFLTGKPQYTLVDKLDEKLDYIIASSSLPLVSKPVTIDGMVLCDGGVVDPIPIRFAESRSDIQVIVLTRNQDYRKVKSMSNRIISAQFMRHKRFAKVLSERHIVYNDAVDHVQRLYNENKAIVIRPSKPLVIDRFEKDASKLNDLYRLGYQDTLDLVDTIVKQCQACDNFSYRT